MINFHKFRRPEAGFTLTEIIVATTIAGILGTIVMSFFIFNLRSAFHGEQKLLINGDIRDLTNEMLRNARESNYSLLYRSFYAQNSSTNMPVARGPVGGGAATVAHRVNAGQAGDFLVLVFTENNTVYDSRFYDADPANDPTLATRVTRIVGYWTAPNRIAGRSGQTALYSFDSDQTKPATVLPASTWVTPWGVTLPVAINGVLAIESLLPPATAAAAINTAYTNLILNDIEGRAVEGTQQTGLNFLNFANRSIVVQTRVLHGNRAKRVTNTYNFSITPRG